jgi:trehalose 6-phosphate phosphatase
LPSSTPPSTRLPWSSTQGTALFLDFDGTLADLAPQPDAVVIAPELIDLLLQLRDQFKGALAIVSGRPLSDLDHYLAPLVLPAAAEHGALRRLPDGALIAFERPDLTRVIEVAQALQAQHAGLRVEVKTAAVALHYRHAPRLEDLCRQTLARVVKETPGTSLLSGKFVFEVKPSGVDKGKAIAAFMGEAPFAGRVPVFAGDDVTDESGFEVVQSLGGLGLKIGDGPTQALHRLGSPTDMRHWLASMLANDGPRADLAATTPDSLASKRTLA